MYRIWLERALPTEYAPLVEGIAELLGPATATPDNPLAAIADADAVIAAARIQYNAALMRSAPRLRVICRTGIGYDNIAVADATGHGIAVCNVPDGPSVSTAEHAFALLLALAKNLVPASAVLRQPARADYFSMFTGVELAGLQLGLVGLGRIGRRVAAIAAAFDMRVVAYDPYLNAAARPDHVEFLSSLDALLSTSDVVSLHLPLQDETRHLINRDRLAQMKPGAILINTARGGLVDERALAEALNSGRISAAGLDVFDPEPPPHDHPLLHHPRVVATPHIAAATGAGKRRVWEGAIRQALEVLRGQRPAHLVNPEVWPRPARPRVANFSQADCL